MLATNYVRSLQPLRCWNIQERQKFNAPLKISKDKDISASDRVYGAKQYNCVHGPEVVVELSTN